MNRLVLPLTLPIDIWGYIMTFSTLDVVLSLTSVCKSLYKLRKQDNKWKDWWNAKVLPSYYVDTPQDLSIDINKAPKTFWEMMFVYRRLLRHNISADFLMELLEKYSGQDGVLEFVPFPCYKLDKDVTACIIFNPTQMKAEWNRIVPPSDLEQGQYRSFRAGLACYVGDNECDIPTGQLKKYIIALLARRGEGCPCLLGPIPKCNYVKLEFRSKKPPGKWMSLLLCLM